MNKKLIHKETLINLCAAAVPQRVRFGRTVRLAAAGILVCIMYISCSDPIFHQIEAEVKPKEPKIEGSPSKIVSDDSGNLYTANGSIWKWNGSSWNKEGSPADGIRDVAWAGGALYALSVDNVTTKLFRRDPGTGGWGQVGNASSYGFLQAVYGAGSRLYVSASKDNSFHVLIFRNDRLEETDFHAQIFGAAVDGGNIYFAAKSAVFKTAPSDENLNNLAPIDDSKDKGDWVGMAADAGANTVAAVSRTGYVCIVKNGAAQVAKKENSYYYTGAVGFWNKGALNYLLIGMRGSSYTNGYRELEIQDGSIDTWPYGSPSISVASPEKYNSTLGVHALTAIMQAPGSSLSAEGHPLLFASTQQNGLWSYRGVWNAEE
ncbi:MAG: hypothetical protein LBD20_05625 [Spirochaetaceae bacterium]|jgi:hypothetical protein|nr:hypothetical protein [Spirochaetaceae bacterium]